jgi:hypothetical protein
MEQDRLVDRAEGMRNPGSAVISLHTARATRNAQIALSGTLMAWVGMVGSSHRTWAALAGALCFLFWQFTLNGVIWLRAGERRL